MASLLTRMVAVPGQHPTVAEVERPGWPGVPARPGAGSGPPNRALVLQPRRPRRQGATTGGKWSGASAADPVAGVAVPGTRPRRRSPPPGPERQRPSGWLGHHRTCLADGPVPCPAGGRDCAATQMAPVARFRGLAFPL